MPSSPNNEHHLQDLSIVHSVLLTCVRHFMAGLGAGPGGDGPGAGPGPGFFLPHLADGLDATALSSIPPSLLPRLMRK